ncbi:hypothetical protein GQ464_017340 [Rhodocaloribacter litoris]|uniref:hypothetical protein n=1 Tax=Rhodocaloribacter litoris TaxID=2558931 RepID=UPI00141FBE31|nr:hypothetical protein [Rhodocaloribacter litoris]QXD15147.1 hypothetical protein GQ464_017340 [Rhodocaloribacter litoris]
MKRLFPLLLWLFLGVPAQAQELEPVVPPELRSRIDFERSAVHDANRIRTVFYNYGMVGDFQVNPDLSIFHSVEVPKGSGLNYSDGITPFVLARIVQENGREAYIMETGYRERQATSPFSGRVMRFEPRPGYLEPDPNINKGRSIALSNDPRTWPGAVDASGNPREGVDPSQCWIDKVNDPDDPGWCGSWNGFFGKRPNADQESFFVMDDNFYDAWSFYPDSRDRTRRGLGLRVEVRGFQWANPQAQNVIFWHYDIVNEGTTDYEDIVFGLYMDSGVGGSAVSCDGTPESDDDNAFYNRDFGLNLVYTWDKGGRGVSLSSNCAPTGYLGYAYLETPGNPFDGVDNDEDGITDERRDGGPGERIEGQDAIRAYVQAHYDLARFEAFYGPLEERPAYRAGVWWTGDEDMDWVAEFNDTGADGIFEDDDNPADTGERDGIPTEGEPNFDRTDVNESDMIGLTGFKMNRIRAGAGAPTSETDNIVFFMNEQEWPKRLYEQFTHPDEDVRFDDPLVLNYNIGFLFASGPFRLEAGRRERFSLALAFGQDLTELESTVEVVQSIYAANYQFATPPPLPTVQAYAGDGFVTLTWDNAAERSVDPVTNRNDFEGYRIYRATDPNFLDAQVISNARGTGPFGNGRPIAQFDLANGIRGFSNLTVDGVAYWLGEDTGLTHTFTDSTVTNGQTYYYAVTAYDRGSEEFKFFPSENAITVSRTPRGGTILPKNVVEVRPNPPVPGYVGARVAEGSIAHVEGEGSGSVEVRILNPAAVPDGHTFRLDFHGSADSVRAASYSLTDLTTGEVLFEEGTDLEGRGVGPVGAGLLPVVRTPATVEVDTLRSGFREGSGTTARFTARYVAALPINLRRPGFPEDLVVTFADSPLDTSLAAIGAPAIPARFKIESAVTGRQFDFRFRDVNGDATLSDAGEYIEVMLPEAEGSTRQRPAWRIELDAVRTPPPLATPPGAGDVYELVLRRPFGHEDAFTFEVIGETIDPVKARETFAEEKPYVVPNPYVASASFEPERFAVAGRGERRMEFRAIPAGATIRIYTLRGELVQTLHHDGSTTGMVPWNLRTKDNLEVAPGLYIFHVEADGVGDYVGKFAIIK